MGKFNPTYTLSVECGPFDAQGNATQHVDITLPFSVEFDIRREFLASAQTGTFSIYDLDQKTRNLIYHDRYAIALYAAIQFWANYEGQPRSLIFNGQVRWAYSERVNQKDFVTKIEAWDGGYALANSITSANAFAGQTLAGILTQLNGNLLNVVSSPIIGSFPQKLIRGQALFGNTFKLITDSLPQQSYATIDNNQLKVLNYNECIDATGQVALIDSVTLDGLPTISSATGLLDPPVRSGAMIVCRMLFEPSLYLGQAVFLSSTENKIYNGIKSVAGFSHSGLISPSVGGDRVSEVQLWQGTSAINPSGVVT